MSLAAAPEAPREDALDEATHRGAECRLGVGSLRRRLSSGALCYSMVGFPSTEDEGSIGPEVRQRISSVSHDGAVRIIPERGVTLFTEPVDGRQGRDDGVS